MIQSIRDRIGQSDTVGRVSGSGAGGVGLGDQIIPVFAVGGSRVDSGTVRILLIIDQAGFHMTERVIGKLHLDTVVCGGGQVVLGIIGVGIGAVAGIRLFDQVSCAVLEVQFVLAVGIGRHQVAVAVIFVAGHWLLPEAEIVKVRGVGVLTIDAADLDAGNGLVSLLWHNIAAGKLQVAAAAVKGDIVSLSGAVTVGQHSLQAEGPPTGRGLVNT